MPRGNPAPKLAITVDPRVHAEVLAAAVADGVSVSAWMTTAARDALRRRAGLVGVADWETQHGTLTDVEMTEARERVSAQLAGTKRARSRRAT